MYNAYKMIEKGCLVVLLLFTLLTVVVLHRNTERVHREGKEIIVIDKGITLQLKRT